MDRRHAKWLVSTAANLKIMFAVAACSQLPFCCPSSQLTFFLTQPRSKVCRSVASIFFFRPRAVERESKMCSLFCARGLRASDAIPESLHLTPSLPLLVFNMPRPLHSQVYLPIMWRRSSQFATKKGLKKFRFARRHSNPQGLFKGPYTGTEFFFSGFLFGIAFIVSSEIFLTRTTWQSVRHYRCPIFDTYHVPLKKTSALMDCRHYWLKITTISNIGWLAIYCFSTVNC